MISYQRHVWQIWELSMNEHLHFAVLIQTHYRCRDVRTREVGIQEIHNKIKINEVNHNEHSINFLNRQLGHQVELVRRDYTANHGWALLIIVSGLFTSGLKVGDFFVLWRSSTRYSYWSFAASEMLWPYLPKRAQSEKEKWNSLLMNFCMIRVHVQLFENFMYTVVLCL